MTLEERLNVMDIQSQTLQKSDSLANQGMIPKADNLLMLLVQGLQSNDSKMLNVRNFALKFF
jgi:hypothetical protein